MAMNSAEEYERHYLKAKLEAEIMVSVKLSNDLNAAEKLLEVYRSVCLNEGKCIHHETCCITDAEKEYDSNITLSKLDTEPKGD